MNIVILCGGVGTRLWPLGRKNNPKQFFPMISKKPLVKETYDRFLKVFGKEKIYFSVTEDLVPQLKKVFPKLPAKHFIVEPSRRDTAPAMGFAALNLFLSHPDEPMVFVPSDHFIADAKRFIDCFKAGDKMIKETGKLVDIGVVATFPSTALGYTRIGSKHHAVKGVEVYHFAGHTEKPDAETALKYVSGGDYLWHANYYMWTPRLFLAAIEHYAPELNKTLAEIAVALKRKKKNEVKKLYNSAEKISFDYAVTEKITKDKVLIIKGDFGWSDVGAWDVLHEQLQHRADEHGNVKEGMVVTADTKRSLLYSHTGKVLATVGLENMVVVDTPDALLVCPKSRAQDVKKIFPEIEKKGLHKYL